MGPHHSKKGTKDCFCLWTENTNFLVSCWNETFGIGLTLGKSSPRELIPRGIHKEPSKRPSWRGNEPFPTLFAAGGEMRLTSCQLAMGQQPLQMQDPISLTREAANAHSRWDVGPASESQLSLIRKSHTWVRATQARQKYLFDSQSQNSQQALMGMLDYGAQLFGSASVEHVPTFCSCGITFCSLCCRKKSATCWEISQLILTPLARWLLHQTCQRTQPHLSSQTLHLLQWSLQKKSLLKAKRLTTASVRLTKCPG